MLTLPINNLWELPVTGSKIQLPEFIFLLLIPGLMLTTKIRLNPLIWLDYLLLGLITIFGLSALVNGGNYLEIVGLVYLFVVYLMFSQFFWQSDSITWLQLVVRWLLYAAGLAAFLGIIGITLTSIFGVDNPLSWSAERYYPYLGYVGRARTLTTNPNMLFSFLAMVNLIQIGIWIQTGSLSPKYKLLLFLSLAGMLLTFSKMILAFFISIFWLWFRKDSPKKSWKSALFYSTSIFLFCLLLLGTHLLISPVDQTPWQELEQNAYTENKPLFSYGDYHFILTNYTVNKKAALSAGVNHFPFGLGPGRFNSFVARQKQVGQYPAFFTNYDPHSTYFGTFAEAGILGVLVVLLLFFSIFWGWRKLAEHYCQDRAIDGVVLGMGACIIYIGIEAISTDVLNFRHYWVLLGLLGILWRIHFPTIYFFQKLQK